MVKTLKPNEQDTMDWWRAVVTGMVDKKDVFCLRGTFAGEHEVEGTVTIHKDQAILCAVINTLADLYDENVMLADAKSDIDATDEKHAFIDGQELPQDQIHRVGPVAFDLTVPTGDFEIGHFRLGAGKRRCVTDGYWLHIPSGTLPAGHHKISFHGNSKRGFHTARSYTVQQL